MGFTPGFWFMVGIGAAIAGAILIDWIYELYTEGENDE